MHLSLDLNEQLVPGKPRLYFSRMRSTYQTWLTLEDIRANISCNLKTLSVLCI